jgi:uncharacterized protein (TIGR03492 family)
MSQRILLISNGHGEDNNSSHLIRTLRELKPDLDIAAMPIVGTGLAYRNISVPIIVPTQTLPSGGFNYMNRWLLLEDIRAGLLRLTWQQLREVRRHAPLYDLVFATGDGVGQAFAYLSGLPFISFISPLSALYEGTLHLDFVLKAILRSPRCLTIFTRDSYTAQDLQKQGFSKVQFGGIPALDRLVPTDKDLLLNPGQPMIALLPGSRMPEAVSNFRLQLKLIREIAQRMPLVQFRAALVPDLMNQLADIAQAEGWQHRQGTLSYIPEGEVKPEVEVGCFSDAFSDIVYRSMLVLGMAGLAVDMSVAIGKPVIQVPGEGPQFTYTFAESQNRLLGLSVKTIGDRPATPDILREAAQCTVETLGDTNYLKACVDNGQQRFGPFGGTARIAQSILEHLDRVSRHDEQSKATS